jgi:hypothetical protein
LKNYISHAFNLVDDILESLVSIYFFVDDCHIPIFHGGAVGGRFSPSSARNSTISQCTLTVESRLI